MNRLNRKLATTACVAALLAAAIAAPAASAEVTYSPLYWELLDRYASVEADWAPIRGIYGEPPECALAQQRDPSVGCAQIVVIMNPDGSFGAGWEDDPAVANGWREATWEDCLEPNSQTASLMLWC